MARVAYFPVVGLYSGDQTFVRMEIFLALTNIKGSYVVFRMVLQTGARTTPRRLAISGNVYFLLLLTSRGASQMEPLEEYVVDDIENDSLLSGEYFSD